MHDECKYCVVFVAQTILQLAWVPIRRALSINNDIMSGHQRHSAYRKRRKRQVITLHYVIPGY